MPHHGAAAYPAVSHFQRGGFQGEEFRSQPAELAQDFSAHQTRVKGQSPRRGFYVGRRIAVKHPARSDEAQNPRLAGRSNPESGVPAIQSGFQEATRDSHVRFPKRCVVEQEHLFTSILDDIFQAEGN